MIFLAVSKNFFSSNCTISDKRVWILTLSLKLLPLDIGDEERGYEILDEGLRLVSPLLHPINELVKGVSFELGLLIGLERRGVINCVDHNILKIRVNRALVDGHKFLVEEVLTLPENGFTLTSATLFSLTLPSEVLSEADHSRNLFLLLESD